MKELLSRIADGNVLSRAEACAVIHGIIEGRFNEAGIAALLMGLKLRGVKTDEILGLRDGMIETGIAVDFSPYEILDIVGTGGDGKNTFNISTCSCFVVAGAGFKVAKHGNYAATSTSGASNVMEAHGVKFTADQSRLRRSIEESGFAYLHAPLFALGMKAVAPVRRALGIATCFNLLGPLVNPCRPQYQLLGVANLNQMRLYNSVYERLGIGYGLVTSIDGYDEISLTGTFKVKTPAMEKIFTPADLGLENVTPSDLYGGDTPAEAARIFDDVLEGRSPRAQRDVVIANSAFAIKVIRPDMSVEECMDMARESLLSGRALQSFRKFVTLNS